MTVKVITNRFADELQKSVNKCLEDLEKGGFSIIDVKFSSAVAVSEISGVIYNYSALILYKEK